ncbi:hypothetical protein SynPROS71_00469 [Synechococcus sp. PROS-7-1]|nr:hypothetical protein SynPROS71_00469 [Synechococcus sp. PROS-7-1]
MRQADQSIGSRVRIGEISQKSAWLWITGKGKSTDQLWLPLDVLTGRLGFRRTTTAAGEQLEWFGRDQLLSDLETRTLKDEVAVDALPWFRAIGVSVQRRDTTLELSLAPPRIVSIRQGRGSTAGRVVLDLSTPALIQRDQQGLVLGVKSTRSQNNLLRSLGLSPQTRPEALRLTSRGHDLDFFTLKDPWRIVMDGTQRRSVTSRRARTSPFQAARFTPEIQEAIRKGLILDIRAVQVGVKPLRIYRAGWPLGNESLLLRPLAPVRAQTGLRFLNQLAQPANALASINGGFFNRVRQLPLGAVRLDGVWLSGPILNRGAVGWDGPGPLLFDRLRLDQDMRVNGGRRWGLGFLNSGYVQRGLSRYTRAWGPIYRALSGEEQAILIRDGRVTDQFSRTELARGVPLPQGASLVVARASAPLPARPGDEVVIRLRPSSPVGERRQVMAGGPLLLKGGQVVLRGRQEGFSSGFLGQAAPRTVVAQDSKHRWMLTLEGQSGSDPTLLETTLALQQLGLSDALNLDGGSSTTMLIANRTVMTGRGVPPRIQNGLGLIKP